MTQKVVEGFYPGITTAQIDTLAAETCAYLSQRHDRCPILTIMVAIGMGVAQSFFVLSSKDVGETIRGASLAQAISLEDANVPQH